MGKYLRQLLEDDAPIGIGEPAGDTERCFDPNTGAEVECPPAGTTNPAGDQPFQGGAPQNQDHSPKAEDKEEDDVVDPDKDGACPEGYDKTDDGKCRCAEKGKTKEDLTEKDDDDKDADEKPPWMKDADDDEDDDKDADEDDDDEKEESLLYRSAVADMVKRVQEGGDAREIVRQAFSPKA